MKLKLILILLLAFSFECTFAQKDTLKHKADSTKHVTKDSLKQVVHVADSSRHVTKDSLKQVVHVADSSRHVTKDSLKQVRKDSIRMMKNYYPFHAGKNFPFRFKHLKEEVPYDTIGKQTRFVPSLIIPAVLIGYGLTTISYHGLYSSWQADEDIDRLFKTDKFPIDNYLIFAPYVELGALVLLKVKNRDDLLNTSLLIIKSELIMTAIVFPLKYIVGEERPYSYELGEAGVPLSVRKQDKNAFVSMPSGHTAQAFCAATIVFREYRYKSVWYGVGAYTLATTVGLFRMINDQHWESDVLIGAGIGIFSANMAYAFHEHRWGRHQVVLLPTYDGINKGFMFSLNLNKYNKQVKNKVLF